jgi:hypothetical protein
MDPDPDLPKEYHVRIHIVNGVPTDYQFEFNNKLTSDMLMSQFYNTSAEVSYDECTADERDDDFAGGTNWSLDLINRITEDEDFCDLYSRPI